VICGVYGERAPLVTDCLDRGMAVLADKPLCTDLDQLAAIERAAADASAPLAIMFDKRYYPETRALREVITAGEIGEVVYVSSTGPHKLLKSSRPDWFFERQGYGGIANDLPVHDIDILIQLTGMSHGKVAALTANRAVHDHPGFQDHVSMIIDSPGVQATIDASWLQPEAADVHGHYRMRIVGTAGSAELDWARHLLTVTTHRAPERTVDLPPPVRPVQFFFDALRAGETPSVTTEEAIRATRIALLAQDSADHDGAWRTF
jgi:predicted dehydrogenase